MGLNKYTCIYKDFWRTERKAVGCLFSWHQPVFSSTGCPTIQCNSDANCTALRVQSHKTALISDANHEYWVSRLPTLPSKLATELKDSPQPLPLGLSNHLSTSQDSGKSFTCYYQLIIRNQLRNSQVEKMNRARYEGRCLELPEVLCPLQSLHPSSTRFTNLEALWTSSCRRFVEVFWVGVID